VVISELAAASAQAFLQTVQTHAVTYAVTSRHILTEIADLQNIKDLNVSSLKVLLVNEDISDQLAKNVRAKLPNVELKQGYGAGGLTPPISIGSSLGNAGAPLLQTEFNFDSENTLYVKGPQFPSEYFYDRKQEKPTEEFPGFLKTKDKGKKDGKGNLHVTRQEETDVDLNI